MYQRRVKKIKLKETKKCFKTRSDRRIFFFFFFCFYFSVPYSLPHITHLFFFGENCAVCKASSACLFLFLNFFKQRTCLP